jgi:hypothetical protein
VRRKWRLNRVAYLITCTVSSSASSPRRRNAYAISPVVRRHRLTEEETEKFLLELRIPRAANVAQITHRLLVHCSQKASSELAAQS